MKSVFEEESINELINRVSKLTADTKPVWGKMSSAQMLTHLIIAFNVFTGKTIVKDTKPIFLVSAIIKLVGVSPISFPKNSPTAKEFIVKDDIDFEKAQKDFQFLLQRFKTEKNNVITMNVHPLLGKMNSEQIGKFSYKHINHHLTQFNV